MVLSAFFHLDFDLSQASSLCCLSGPTAHLHQHPPNTSAKGQSLMVGEEMADERTEGSKKEGKKHFVPATIAEHSAQ